MPEGDAELINFTTISMAPGGAANLLHTVGWQSSTGNLGDLANVYTREHVMWDAAPAEFGPPGEYAGAGDHNGLGSNNATGGRTDDSHSIFPTGFKYGEIPDGGRSAVWTMRQVYEVKTADQDWQPIPGATYEISRWFEREGRTIRAYCAKRGTGTDNSSAEASAAVPDWFDLVSKPQLQDFTTADIDKSVVDSWNERALKELSEGQTTPFFEKDEYILIVHPDGKGVQPYIDWAQEEGWSNGTLEMLKKGGAFSAGSIRAQGVGNRANFEAAIERVSKKEVKY